MFDSEIVYCKGRSESVKKKTRMFFFFAVFAVFWDQINTALVSRRDCFKNIKKLTLQKRLTGSVY